MIKKTIILSLLRSTLLLTGCSDMHQIDDTPNYDTNGLKRATVMYHYRDQDIFRNIESYHYHSSHHREHNQIETITKDDRIIGFPIDTH